jgi:hypothetical protein
MFVSSSCVCSWPRLLELAVEGGQQCYRTVYHLCMVDPVLLVHCVCILGWRGMA